MMALFISATGVRSQLHGVLESTTAAPGIVISAESGDGVRSYVRVPLVNRVWNANYGEHRQLPDELQEMLPKYGESVLVLRFPETREVLSLFFTV